MIKFTITKQSQKSRARLGVLQTPHGSVKTPAIVPVATQAVVKTLTAEEVAKTNSQILINNTYHIHFKPGDKIVKKFGGVHKFMNWPRPLMTDSGGFQVFSLGFGRDLGVGKILKWFPKATKETVVLGSKSRYVRITDKGVKFRANNGDWYFIGPRESIQIQQNLGADIIFAFDECTAPLVSYAYAKKSLERTHAWAQECLRRKTSEQALYGIIQGSRFKLLREKAAREIGSMNFAGFGIGGDLGRSKKEMAKIIRWVIALLPAPKPRHLLGIGYPEDMELIIKEGIDTFDCTVPTHYARTGVAFTSVGKLNLKRRLFTTDRKPLDQQCGCDACQNYTRGYIHHLLRAKEITGLKLLTIHNLFFFNDLVVRIREKIKAGKL